MERSTPRPAGQLSWARVSLAPQGRRWSSACRLRQALAQTCNAHLRPEVWKWSTMTRPIRRTIRKLRLAALPQVAPERRDSGTIGQVRRICGSAASQVLGCLVNEATGIRRHHLAEHSRISNLDAPSGATSKSVEQSPHSGAEKSAMRPIAR